MQGRMVSMAEQDNVDVQDPPTQTAEGKWHKYDVSALISEKILVIGDGYRAKNTELSKVGIPFARAGNIKDGFQFSGADQFPEDQLQKVGEKISRPGDTVFTSKGTVGRFAFVTADTPRFVYSPQLSFWRTVNTNAIEPRFLHYWMAGGEFYSQFKSVAGQTDMAEYVSLGDQRRMYITLPPLSEQRAIAHVLGTLDDKIELNRRMNETLEEMARALFKSWFVDFDPVRAKMDGRWRRGESLPTDLYDLFPNRMVPSELGEIPDGWEVGNVADAATILGGTTPSTKVPKYWEGGPHFWATPKDLSTLDVSVLLATERRITDAGLQRIGSGLQPPGTLLMSSRAPIGYLAITEVPVAINQGFIAMQPREGIPSLFLLYWCEAFMDEIVNHANGSTFLEISKSNFREIPLLLPSTSVLGAYNKLVSPLHEKTVANEVASRRLAALRDALLPGLLAGTVRLRDPLPDKD